MCAVPNMAVFCSFLNSYFPGMLLYFYYLARMGAEEANTGFSWGDLREEEHLQDLGVDGRMILKWIITKWYVET